MTIENDRLPVLLIGGGMESREVIMPTLFQERRRGKIGWIGISSLTGSVIQGLRKYFPNEEFTGYPDPDKVDPDKEFPELFKEALDELPEGSLVIVAVPDHIHTTILLPALERGLDCIVEKPLCLLVEDAHKIIEAADEKALYILTDYHKRHDRAVRAARARYRKGDLGELLHGHAWIEEKKEMPLKNFAAWAEKSSPFEYIGVHYVDAYYFITGLMPKRLAAFGQKKFLPTQGKDAFDAIQAVIEWEDGSVFWIQSSWVCPESNTALTNQGLNLHGTKGEYWADHKNRNLSFTIDDTPYEHYNPNFFRPYDSWEEEGLVDWVGYGYESIQQGIDDMVTIRQETKGLSEKEALEKRRELLAKWENLRALPRQALIGVAVNEAVRLSIDNNSRYVGFDEKMYPKLL
ncbi:MAG: hypothetical protein AMS15_07780 [Planctomycetes bacterium DG_23]|nr:MAG: hypothetical protein AMS15_07780 [Planctomycetes bacterium DG_23]